MTVWWGYHPQGCEPSHFVGANFSCPGSWILLSPVIKPSQKHLHKKPQKKLIQKQQLGTYLQSNLLKIFSQLTAKGADSGAIIWHSRWLRSELMRNSKQDLGTVLFPCHYKQTSAPYLKFLPSCSMHVSFSFFSSRDQIRSIFWLRGSILSTMDSWNKQFESKYYALMDQWSSKLPLTC